MGSKVFRSPKGIMVVVLLLLSTLAMTQSLKGLEEQLAGVRLGAPFIDYNEQGMLRADCLMKIYGMPDYIVGRGTAPAQPGLGMPGMPGGPMMPGMPGGPMMPGGPGAPMGMGSGFGGQPTLPGVMAGMAGLGQLAGTPLARPGMPTGPMMPGGPMFGGEPGSETGGFPGFGPMAPGLGGGATAAPTYPRPEELPWAIPPFVQPEENEIYFVYRRPGAHLNFLMEFRKEEPRNVIRVVAITVAGRRYDGARTAKGDPFKAIKLGDDLQRVLVRYGQPDEIVYYNPFTLQLENRPSRNMILRYHRSSNIEFTLLNERVVRIFIFAPGQVTLTR